MSRKFLSYCKPFCKPSSLIAFGLALGAASLAFGANPNPAPTSATCTSMLSTKADKNGCSANMGTIRSCIQNGVAAQTPGSATDLKAQLANTSTASQTLAKLDFQCQYILLLDAESNAGASAPSTNSLGGSLKNMLGLSPEPAAPATAQDNSAAENQAAQLNNLKPTQLPSKKNTSDQDNKSSINWF